MIEFVNALHRGTPQLEYVFKLNDVFLYVKASQFSFIDWWNVPRC